MPDLVTHLATAWLLAQVLPRARLAVVVAGTVAPDLFCRLPALVATAVDTRLVELPDLLVYGWEPLHTPAGLLLEAYALAHLFREEARRRAFVDLLAGMALHLALDLTQDHYGVGTALLFPFSFRTFELGWFGSEESIFVAPALAILVGLVWLWRRQRARTAGG